MSDLIQRTLEYLATTNQATARRIWYHIGADNQQASATIQALLEIGKIEEVQEGTKVYYRLKDAKLQSD